MNFIRDVSSREAAVAMFADAVRGIIADHLSGEQSFFDLKQTVPYVAETVALSLFFPTAGGDGREFAAPMLLGPCWTMSWLDPRVLAKDPGTSCEARSLADQTLILFGLGRRCFVESPGLIWRSGRVFDLPARGAGLYRIAAGDPPPPYGRATYETMAEEFRVWAEVIHRLPERVSLLVPPSWGQK